MAHCVGGTLKLTGIFTLGLLSGTQLFSFASVRSILALPSSTQATTPLTTLPTRVSRPLSIFTTSALFLAYFLAPPRGKHPYLLLCGMFPLLTLGVDVATSKDVKEIKEKGEEVNGEVLRDGLGKYCMALAVQGGLSVIGFGMGLVGIWGERM